MSQDDEVMQKEKDSIIKDLEAGIPAPGAVIPGVCAYHPSLARASRWIILRLDGNPMPAGKLGLIVIALKTCPWAVVAIVALVLAYMVLTGDKMNLGPLIGAR